TLNSIGYVGNGQPRIGFGGRDHDTGIYDENPILRRIFQFVDVVSSTISRGASAEGKEGHVGTEVPQRLRYIIKWKRQIKQSVQADDRGRRVGTTATETSSRWDVLSQMNPHVGRYSCEPFISVDCPNHQVGLVSRRFRG